MKAVARRREGFAHEVAIEGGHTIVIDEPEEAGGANQGPSPTRAVAAALAACTAITCELYAQRKGWELGAVEVEVEMDYGRNSSIASLAVTLRVPEPLEPEQQSRLLTIAGKCPVHRALRGETPVEISDRIECPPARG